MQPWGIFETRSENKKIKIKKIKEKKRKTRA